jgi:hypothetical protein
MFSLSSWLHLRIPFSYFLLPVFLFSLAISPNFTQTNLLWSFLLIHLFLYPASNAYNSYFDKDKESIGGLKNPPQVKPGLYWLALIFDTIAIVWAYQISPTFAFMIFIYGVVSKAYSHPWIRIKKYPYLSWLIAGVFQGSFSFIMCYIGINGFTLENIWQAKILTPALLTTLMLLANYPLTQIYQHKEDASRGDKTLSLVLGIKNTFLFVMLIFFLAMAGFAYYLINYFSLQYFQVFLYSMGSVLIYFVWWMFTCFKDERNANYSRAMWMNLISSTALNFFFIYLFLKSTGIIQAFQ